MESDTCKDPYWMTRPRNILPLFVDPDVLWLVAWARELPAEGRTAIYWRGDLPTGMFTPAQAMDGRFGEHPHGSRRGWWERVQKAARDANVLAECSWGVYKLTELADDLDVTPRLVRTF